ncbi:MAG TPA: TRAP transporter small permease [Spirochaetia bacterium]|nr:TRAP transporter small permease [Spirochaetales bacterium]HRY80353.1 TRAP transporter small permease [Spirochaetia bacterium]HRZ88142.1 TRAP transporter small permease [Spirochaetia bacterium]
MKFLERLDAAVLAALKLLTIGLFSALMLILTANVFVRFVPILSLHWLDEIVELLFAALVFYGSAALWILEGHFQAGEWLAKSLKSPRMRAALRLAVDLGSLLFLAVFFRYSFQLVRRSMEVTAVFLIPKRVLYSCMPLSSAVMLFYSLRFVLRDFRELRTPTDTR